MIAISALNGFPCSRPLSFPPIIILSWFERDFLIDDNMRVNFWNNAKNAGPHAVLQISKWTYDNTPRPTGKRSRGGSCPPMHPLTPTSPHHHLSRIDSRLRFLV